jgi:predicted ATPase
MKGATNLVQPPGPFVGREEALVSLERSLAGSRVVTLLGPGGVGKTRLAKQFGLSCTVRFGGGVWFCDLSSATTEVEIAVAVAEALDVQLQRTGAVAHLGRVLKEMRSVLLVLDNAEQAVGAVAGVVTAWRSASPATAFLVTSRRPLSIAGEVRQELAPLTLQHGVALFEDRITGTGGVVSDEDRVALQRLVARLDGIPLAIELAAGRLGAFTPAELLERLDERFRLLRSKRRDVSPRHATLDAAIDWSWRLLDPAERDALVQCAVFHGGFSMDAAEAVLQLEDPDAWVPDAIQALREHALLRAYPAPTFPKETRFRLYDSIRDFVEAKPECADRFGEAAQRHERWALGFAERCAARLDADAFASEGMRRLALERDNVLAVYRRGVKERPEAALRALLALDPLMHWSGSTALHLERLNEVLTQVDGVPAALVSRGRIARSLASVWCGDSASASVEIEGLVGALDDPALVAEALLCLSVAAHQQDALDDAARWAGDALKVGETHELKVVVAKAHARLAAALALKDPTLARIHYKEAVRVERSLGKRLGDSFGVTNLASSATEPAIAIAMMEDWLTVIGKVGAAVGGGELLGNLAASHARIGALGTAADIFERAIKMAEGSGNRRALVEHHSRLGAVRQAQGRREAARKHYDQAWRMARDEELSLQEASVRSAWASLLHEEGDIEGALAMYRGASDAIEGRDVPWLAGQIAARYGAALAEYGDTAAARQSFSAAASGLEAETDEHRALGIYKGFLEIGEHARKRAAKVLQLHQRTRAWRVSEDHSDDEVGLAARLLESGIARAARAAGSAESGLLATADGRWFSFQGTETDLSRRRALRLILKFLAEKREAAPGEDQSLYDLLEAGWPGERTLPEAGANRVYSAIRDLRKMGLRTVLIRMDAGYLLDPAVPLGWMD